MIPMDITTRIDGFEIRKAVRGDVPLILDFIKKLADYEKLTHEVVATEKQLEKYLFGEEKVAEVVIGYYLGDPVGFALYFYNFSTFLAKPGIYLEDLYVLEAHRGKGFGKLLLAYLAKLAVEQGCGRLEWAVLDWNEPSIKFYKSLGAKLMDEWIVNRLTGQELEDLANQF
jgi:GNAT superfamily N-acetyltransferase